MAALKSRTLIVPPFPKPGDMIGIATPASPYHDESLQAGISFLTRWGFKVVLGRKRPGSRGYLAGTDQERTEELMSLLSNPGIKAILCARGGYGVLRILNLLDFKRISAHPKLVMGFSDITVLLLALWKKVNLMTFHGPLVTTLRLLTAPSLARMEAVLKGNYQIRIPLIRRRAINPENAQGFLLGGNLTLVTHLLGTPYEPNWDQALLFLEDCHEDPYRVDRLFTHLRLSGCLDRVSAILLGTFTGSNKKTLSLGLFKEILGKVNVPVWTGLPVGHGPRNIPLPIGAPAFIDAEKGLLSVEL